MDIFFKIKGNIKKDSKSIEENTNFHRKLYVAYLNETFLESDEIANQTYRTYILKNGVTSDEIHRLPLILSLHDQMLLNEMDYSD